MKNINNQKVIFFDGVCGFCNQLVFFIFKIDSKKSIHFASLQSAYARAKLGITSDEGFQTIKFLSNKKIFEKSDAVIEIFRQVGGIWRCSILLYIVPKLIRNLCYDLIARNRQKISKLFSLNCQIPSVEMKTRFLE